MREHGSILPSPASATVAAAAAGAAVLVAHWRLKACHRPEVYCGNNSHLRKVLSQYRDSAASGGDYSFPPLYRPPLLFSWWPAQLALLMVRNILEGRDLKSIVRFSDPELLTMDDGGEVALLWAHQPTTPTIDAQHAIDAAAPILCVFHSITYDPTEDAATARLLAGALMRGLRPVVLLRRGHIPGRPLASPAFNPLGSTDDTRAMLAGVRRRFPLARALVAVAISAGTGTLVRFAGEEGRSCPFAAIALNCPGYDTAPPRGAFELMYPPFLMRHLLKITRTFFLTGVRHRDFWERFERNAESASASASSASASASAAAQPSSPHTRRVVTALQRARAATSMGELWESIASGLGGAQHEDAGKFHRAINPMATVLNIAVPALAINARDDPVCVMAPRYAPLFGSGTRPLCLALTSRGTHCAFLEVGVVGAVLRRALIGGHPRGGRHELSWADRLCLDFIMGALQVGEEEELAGGDGEGACVVRWGTMESQEEEEEEEEEEEKGGGRRAAAEAVGCHRR